MINIRNARLLLSFGERLRNLREQQHLSQEALANEAEIPISQVGRIERGEVNPTLSTLNSIASGLKITLQELLDF
ncbi:MAG TPA: helix-turn-helix transcriptional regulator [Cyclobacteriaceae bacterium]|nr:helix-turn-helix transcriptional regulator [Cyclobacteriaceae bacterium]HRJ80682.1 helix-turn-helix transcriptional regulator [Cyclobacteriaceae bacterium]